jgi:hypothetical protein
MPTAQFKQFIDNLAAFNFGNAQDSAIQANTEALAQFQAEQFAQGKDKNNEPITLNGNGYNPFYADKKRKYGEGLGRVTDRVTLFLTGELYHELFASMKGKKVMFSSRVPYYKELISRTGDVTGLNTENAKDFAFEFVLPFVSKELNAKTGLRIKVGGNVL